MLSELFFQFCSSQKKGPNHRPEHYPTNEKMFRTVIWNIFWISQTEKLSENKLPLWECCMSVHTWPFWSCFCQITATGFFCFSHLLKGVSELTTWILFILTILQEVVKIFKFVFPPKKSLAIRAAHVKSHFGHWRRSKSFEWENSNVLSTS